MTVSDFLFSVFGFISGSINELVTYIFNVPALFYTFSILIGCGAVAIVYRIFKGVIL